ncbi:MAG: ABC transporter ATP-binding protein [Brevundimonas sp.]
MLVTASPALAPPAVSARGVSRRYGAKTAVQGADIDLRPGRITCLLGPSGCGKSTLLRLIAGLEPADEGEIEAGGQVVTGPGVHTPPEQRGVGLVFQDYALFPHLSVLANVAFGLKHLPRKTRNARALALLEKVRLAARADAWPHMLSGGEQQRVALARALAREPAAVLLDEPFSGLDSHLKAEVRHTLLSALRAAGAAVLIVTHDAEEALLMADDLALMSEGRILQAGDPGDCYLNPASMAAARLLGEANALPARVAGGVAETAFGDVPAPGLPDGAGVVMVRPEGLRLWLEGARAQIAAVAFGGGFHEVTVAAGGQTARLRLHGGVPAVGEEVSVVIDADRARVFPA